MSNTLPPSLGRKHWDTWFLNSSNPKLVQNSWNLACYHGAASTCRGNFFVPFGTVWVYVSHKPELLTTSMMVSVGNVPPLGMKRYPLPLIVFNFFSHLNIEQLECCVIFCDFRGLFGHFYALTKLSMHFMCIIQIWTRCTCSSAYKLVEKSNLCPWVHA